MDVGNTIYKMQFKTRPFKNKKLPTLAIFYYNNLCKSMNSIYLCVVKTPILAKI